MSKVKLSDPFIRSLEKPKQRIEIYDTLTTGLALRVTPTGAKSFVYRYRINNEVKRYTIGQFPKIGLADARKICKDLHLTKLHGDDPLYKRERAKSESKLGSRFIDLANRFKEEYLPQLRKRTADEYFRIIDRELTPTLGKVLISDIKRADVIKLLDKIALNRNTPVMANRVKATISSIFSFAVNKALLEYNIIRDVKKYTKTKTGERVEVKRDRFYTADEIHRIWQAVDSQQEPTRSYYMFLMMYGQRKTETALAKWEHIDFDQRTWTIPAINTKAKRKHILPLTNQAIKLLQQLKDYSGGGTWVFRSRYSDTPIKWVDKAKQRIAKISEVSDFRPHDLRRTLATNLSEMGTERVVLKKIQNHIGQDITDVYDRHDYRLPVLKALQEWSNRLMDIAEGNEAVLTNIELSQKSVKKI